MPSATGVSGALIQTVLTNVDYIGAAVSTMLAYEYFITLGDEVKYIWRGRSLGPSVLFYMNRYFNLLLSIYQLIVLNPAYHRSAERCTREMPTLFVLEVLGSFPWGAFSALRAYALSRNIPLSLFIFLLSMVPIALNLVCFKFGLGGIVAPVVSCVGYNRISVHLSRKFTIAARTAVILADALLLVITWTRLSKQRRLGLRGGSGHYSLSDVLLRDGTIYFLIMLFLNCLHIAFTVVSIFIVSSLQHLSSVSIFVTPLTAILVSRFIIHLQAADRQSSRSTLGTETQTAGPGPYTPTVTSVIFDSVIGSLRCELEPEDFMRSTTSGGGGGSSEEYPPRERAGDESSVHSVSKA